MNNGDPCQWNDAAGIGFRTVHFAGIVATRPEVAFLEIHAENFLGGGASLQQLQRLRHDWPISVHGVGLSLGSASGLDADHLERLAALVERIEPVLVSEHLSWSTVNGCYLNDLMPLPLTTESLGVVAENMTRLQDRLRRPVLVENPSSYLRFAKAEMDEAAFLAALTARTGCGLLLDVNNIFVTCANLGGSPEMFIDALPAASVAEIHLAGHSAVDADGTPLLIDDHGSPVAAPVWALFERAVRRCPAAAPLIEWDSQLPALPVLLAEADEANRRRQRVLQEMHHVLAA